MAAQLPPGVDLSTVPMQSPPPGHIPNFDNPPDSQAPIVIGTGVAFGSLSLIFVCLRVWTNMTVSKKLRADDYLCILSWLLVTGYFCLAANISRLLRHTYDVPLAWLDSDAVKTFFATNFIVGPTVWTSKVTILVLYYRLFSAKVWLRRTCYIAAIVLTLVFWTSPIIAGVFCTPKPGNAWDFEVAINCQKSATSGLVYGPIAVVADAFLLALPLPIIFKLKMALSKKLALVAVFMTGFVALVASVISLVFKIQIYSSTDVQWNAALAYAGVIIETYLTVMVSCAPAMSALWIHKISKSPFITSLQHYILGSRRHRKSSESSESSEESGSSEVQLKRPRQGSNWKAPEEWQTEKSQTNLTKQPERQTERQTEESQTNLTQQPERHSMVVGESEATPEVRTGIYTSTRIDQFSQHLGESSVA